jgi:hypothetical protein
MPKIDVTSLRFALLAGAAAGAVWGMLISSPLRASDTVLGGSARTASCSRTVCESATWLRTPVRYRQGVER